MDNEPLLHNPEQPAEVQDILGPGDVENADVDENADAGPRGSFKGGVFNLTTSIVGAGIMALPAALKVLGLIPGLLIIIGAGVLTYYSVNLIRRLGRSPDNPTTSSSYDAVVAVAFGDAMRRLLQFLVVLNNYGMLVVYMIIIGDVMSGTTTSTGVHHTGLFEGWFGHHWWTGRFFLLSNISIFASVALIKVRSIASLTGASALSVFLAFFFVGATTGVAIVKMASGKISCPRLLPHIADRESYWKMFTTVPVIVTSYICHYSIHPIESELENPGRMTSIIGISLAICSTVYTITSSFAFMLFGEGTLDDVLANFDTDFGWTTYGSILNESVRVSYGMHLMLVFPVVFYSLRLYVDGLLPRPLPVPLDSEEGRFYTITAGLMLSVFLGANVIPHVWFVFQIIGPTTSVVIGLVFPAAIALRDFYGTASWIDKALSWFMLFIAISSSPIALWSNVYDIFTS